MRALPSIRGAMARTAAPACWTVADCLRQGRSVSRHVSPRPQLETCFTRLQYTPRFCQQHCPSGLSSASQVADPSAQRAACAGSGAVKRPPDRPDESRHGLYCLAVLMIMTAQHAQSSPFWRLRIHAGVVGCPIHRLGDGSRRGNGSMASISARAASGAQMALTFRHGLFS
jgi:hypothetical protein